MPRPAPALPHDLRSRPRARPCSAGLVCILVFALIGAPASSALRNECDLCPPTCPMHQHRDRGEPAAAPRLGCHGAPASAPHHHGAAHAHSRSVGRAPCGNHGVVPATVLPPMILPVAQYRPVVAAVHTAPRPHTARRNRPADSPDTPPPIDAA